MFKNVKTNVEHGKIFTRSEVIHAKCRFRLREKTHFIIVIDHLRLVCLKRQIKGNVTFFEGDFRDVLFVSIQSTPVQKT